MRIIMQAFKADGSEYLSEPMELSISEYVAFQDRLALDGYISQAATRIDMVCDFCSEPGISWRFEIEPGGIIGTIMDDESMIARTHVDEDGKWGACKTCHDFIVAENWDGLMQRSLAKFADFMKPIMEAAIVTGPHRCFRAGYEKTHPKPIPVISDAELMGR